MNGRRSCFQPRIRELNPRGAGLACAENISVQAAQVNIFPGHQAWSCGPMMLAGQGFDGWMPVRYLAGARRVISLLRVFLRTKPAAAEKIVKTNLTSRRGAIILMHSNFPKFCMEIQPRKEVQDDGRLYRKRFPPWFRKDRGCGAFRYGSRLVGNSGQLDYPTHRRDRLVGPDSGSLTIQARSPATRRLIVNDSDCSQRELGRTGFRYCCAIFGTPRALYGLRRPLKIFR